MSPIRFLIIGILLYIGYRLIFGGKSETNSKSKKEKKPADTQQVVEDILVEDPICGSLVPKQQAVALERQNKDTVYFCSRECCDKFVQKGEKK